MDVTLPYSVRYPVPLIVMLHGWGQSRTAWESQTVANANPNVSGWNNVAFAAAGYAVLNYTARGWHDSCGPDDAQVPDNQATLPAACTSHAYWVHLADPRWEVHDAQYLIGVLVDAGLVAPSRIGVTGGSYGGGQSWLLALLNDRTMNIDGTLAPWTSPKGTRLRIAAAVPEYTWASLTNSLAPNGRATDTSVGAPAQFDRPVGVPIQSYLTGLFADGPVLRNGFYSPPGIDPTADLTAWYARFNTGSPFSDDPTTDPIVYQALQQLDIRSPLYYTPDAPVPIFQVQGLTDPLFPPVQAIMMRNHVLAWDTHYPITDFFGDVGHSNANNPADVWAVANSIGRQFFDFYLKGAGSPPGRTVTAMTTDCVAGQTRQTYTAASWPDLSRSVRMFTAMLPQETTSASAGPEGPATDPIVNSGCLSVRAAEGSGVAAWTWDIATSFTLVGQPRLTLTFLSTGIDTELNIRVWDISADGSTQTLVSRGTYRYLGTAGTPARVTLQTSANAWQFQSGHMLRLEVVGHDSPYYQADTIPSTTTVTTVSLSLPASGS